MGCCILREHPEWRRELARKMGCRLEYRWYGFDMDCNGRRYLVRRLRKDGSVAVSLQSYLEAKKFSPWLMIVNEKDKRVLELKYMEWVALALGRATERYYIDGRLFRVVIVPGRNGRIFPYPLPERLYRKIMKAMEDSTDWIEMFEKMLSCLGYYD